jgi:signal transduction histidine kinase/ActR/RegA family two-component response regulator
MESHTRYSDLAAARRREAGLRLGLALVVGGVAALLVDLKIAAVWLLLVIVSQAFDGVFLRRFEGRVDADIPRRTRVLYGVCALMTALTYSGIALPGWLAADLYGKVFAYLLPAGALLNLAMSLRRAPLALVGGWIGHIAVLMALPWLVPAHEGVHVLGAICVTLSVLIFVAHLIIATRRSAKAADALEDALRDAREALERSATAEHRLSVAAEIANLYIYEVDFRRGVLTSAGAQPEFLERPITYDAVMEDGFHLVDPRDRPDVVAAWRAYRAGDAPYRAEYRVSRQDGQDVWVYAGAELFRDAEGEPIKLVGIMRDITDRRQEQAELVEARNRAEAGSRAKGDFLAMMSHEIRTPLNGILGMAQVMMREPLPALQRHRLEVIGQSGQVLLELLNNALDLAKIEADRLELEEAPVDVAALVHGVVDIFASHVAEKDVSLEAHVEPQAEGVYLGDATRLRQVLNNLVSNAVKFTPRGHVRVTLRRIDDGLRIVVSDTGVGIPAAQQAKLFGAFVQADASTTRRFGGSGLGLAITRRLVTLMGGTLSFESIVDRGSTFTADLPLSSVEPDGLHIAEAASAHTDLEEFPPLRVLAAEDNPVNQLVLRTLLLQVGVDPYMVSDGAQAVEAWSQQPWDLILMDVQMPVMDGVTAVSEIRRRELATGRRTPVIALTANVMSHQVSEYLAAGVDQVVAKPIEADRLFAAMEASLEAAAASAAGAGVGAAGAEAAG